MGDEALALVDRRDRVGIITLSRPEARNAINSAITVAIADAIEALEADDNVWVLVITGGAMGLERLPRRLPPAIAMELILTGRAIDASRALELGLINRVVPRGSCVDAAVELAQVVSEGAPLAVRYSKAVARASFSMGEESVATDLRDLRRAVFKSEDFREGPRAFAEKRVPEWKGR